MSRGRKTISSTIDGNDGQDESDRPLEARRRQAEHGVHRVRGSQHREHDRPGVVDGEPEILAAVTSRSNALGQVGDQRDRGEEHHDRHPNMERGRRRSRCPDGVADQSEQPVRSEDPEELAVLARQLTET
ncbi:MAG TPA: hypothetical protein VHJ58_05285 [Vicinamibacterales bacterium]|nr:hypothetical protein [Vicinamibacterales bacterium]